MSSLKQEKYLTKLNETKEATTHKPTRFSCDRTPHKQPGILKTEIATSFLSLTQSKTVLAIDTMKATKRNKTKTMFRLFSSVTMTTRPTFWQARAFFGTNIRKQITFGNKKKKLQ